MKSITYLFCLLTLLTATSSSAQNFVPDQPEAAQIAIATAHPLATEAGLKILKQGGNAFDAAVAISFALAVAEPYSSGIGGGGFWMLHLAQTNETLFVDGREVAPAQSSADMYLDPKGNYIAQSSVNGPLAAAIPGSVAALHHISSKYGKLEFSQLLQPAIEIAEKGFAVSPHYQQMARFRLQVLQKYPHTAKIFLQDNQVPAVGHLIIQKDLARTLRYIAQKGLEGFYQGDIAQELVTSVQQAGGIWQLEDLQKYPLKIRQPLQFQFKNLKIYTAPPPSSGGLVLNIIFNLLNLYPWERLTSLQQTHLLVEAMRRAYHARARYMGDADFVDIPQELLSSAAYAHGLSTSIRLDKALDSEQLARITIEEGARDTTHFVVMDQQGNSVSATMSINYPFGSGFVAGTTGILLNDEMDDFSVKAGTPNVYGLVGAKANEIQPRKRPLSSMSPSYIERLDPDSQKTDAIALLGTPGGSRIISMVLLGILELLKNDDPQQWVQLPRFHHQYLPDVIEFEAETFTDDAQFELQALGHRLKPLQHRYGNMQAIFRDKKSNRLKAASDPRGEGRAIVTSIRQAR